MFQVGDCVVYKKDVCRIKEIREKYMNDQDYYILVPIYDESLKIQVPTNNQFGFIRDLISQEEVKDIISKINEIGIIEVDDRFLESEYKKLLQLGNHEDLIKIIKTTYLRNKERMDQNKKIGEKDSNYFRLAERYLYNEFSIVLGLSVEETKNYVIDEVEKLKNR